MHKQEMTWLTVKEAIAKVEIIEQDCIYSQKPLKVPRGHNYGLVAMYCKGNPHWEPQIRTAYMSFIGGDIDRVYFTTADKAEKPIENTSWFVKYFAPMDKIKQSLPPAMQPKEKKEVSNE